MLWDGKISVYHMLNLTPLIYFLQMNLALVVFSKLALLEVFQGLPLPYMDVTNQGKNLFVHMDVIS